MTQSDNVEPILIGEDGHLDGLRRAGLLVVNRQCHRVPAGKRQSTLDVVVASLVPATRDANEAGWRRFIADATHYLGDWR